MAVGGSREHAFAGSGASASEGVPRKRRILFIAEAVTLAHVARPLALARMLDPAGYDVTIACDPRYDALLGPSEYKRLVIHSISSEQFLKSLAGGSRLYGRETLASYVKADLRLIEECQPDVIIGDFRLSLSISARVARKPYITITNAYWSPHARPRFTVPELPLLKFTGVKLGQQVFNLVRPMAFRYHALPLNQLRKQYGLPPLGLDLGRVYTDADYTLYADIPQLVPTYDLPDTHHYIGPTPWSPAGPLPDWWGTLPKDRPIIYVTLGSSGYGSLLPLVLQALAGVPVTVIAASAGRNRPNKIPSNAFVTDYLPGEQAARRAALVICNGGSLTCYQAFAHGKPVIGMPGNLDQYLNMHYIQAAGAGRMIRAGTATAAQVAESVRQILENPGYAAKTKGLMEAISACPSQSRFDEMLERAYRGSYAGAKK
ncbi:MAG TPA: glycosyltransferase [Gallionella sp.]|nr:glycosyltransferase [Gallionella sp.]